MKLKRFAAFLAAGVFMLSAVSCGKKDKSENSSSKADSAAESAASGTSSEQQLELDGLEMPQEIATDGTYENGVFENPFFTINVDPEKWEYKQDVNVDCEFAYKAGEEDVKLQTASFNVVTMDAEMLGGMTTAEEYGRNIEKAMKESEDYNVVAADPITIGEYEAFELSVAYALGDEESMTVTQVILINEENMAIISYGVADSAAEQLAEEFDSIIDSFKFK